MMCRENFLIEDSRYYFAISYFYNKKLLLVHKVMTCCLDLWSGILIINICGQFTTCLWHLSALSCFVADMLLKADKFFNSVNIVVRLRSGILLCPSMPGRRHRHRHTE